MNDVCEHLIDDHKHCDDLLLRTEGYVGQGAWEEALRSFQAFSSAFSRHLEMEESIMFPMIREAAGADAWPVNVLSAEHVKLKMILLRMEQSVHAENRRDFFLHCESFFILMQNHSVKEEEVLYPALKRLLPQRLNEVCMV